MNTEQNYQNEQYDEISLRELIDVVLDGKKMIAIVTAICLILAGIYSFVIVNPTYEAKTVLLTAPVEVGQTSIEGVNNVIKTYNKYPEMKVETYLAQIKSPEVLQRTIEELQLKNKDGKLITTESLASAIEVSNIKDTNLINIVVTKDDPEMAAKIANALGQNFIKFITQNIQNKSRASAALIQEQLQVEEANIEAATKVLTDYMADSRNLTDMKNEMNSIISQLNSYRTQIKELDNSIKVEKTTLDALHKAGVTGYVDVNSLNIDLGSSGNSGSVEMNINASNQVEKAVLSMKIANLETALVQNVSKKEVLEGSIEKLQSDLVAIQTKIAEEEYTYNSIQRDLSLAKEAYNAYQQRHKEAILTAATDLGSTSVVVSSSAAVPNGPVGVRKALNLTIGMVLGLIIGVLATFFQHYWRSTSDDKEKKVIA